MIPSIGLYRSPYRQLTRSRRIETAVLPELRGKATSYEATSYEATSYEATSLLTKERPLAVSRKPENIAKKSNDDDNVELDEQSADELISELLSELIHVINNTQNSHQTCAQLHCQYQNEETGRTKSYMNFYARYKRTSL